MNKINISFFIGSGFSLNADFPSVKEVSEYIIKHQKEFGVQNQLFSKLLDIYVKNTPNWNYEEFYDFLGVICSHPINYFSEFDKLKTTSDDELNQYFKKNIWIEDYINANVGKFPKISISGYPKFMEEFNFFLKAAFCQTDDNDTIDTVEIYKLTSKKANDIYFEFIKLLRAFVKETNSINFFTTNHDNLIENLIINDNKLKEEFCDGFDTPQSSQFYCNSLIIPQYVANYAKKLCVFKLHGSLDYYRTLFPAGNLLKLPFNFIEFNQIYQKDENHANPIKCDTTPQFITGKYKDVYYREVTHYKTQFAFFKEKLPQSDIVIVIGYGFPDAEINEELRKILKDTSKKKIIIDKYEKKDTENAPIFKNMEISEVDCIKYNIKVSLEGAIDSDDILNFLGI
jgi:NAD-dependent SIR2 family protein deacetylase